MALVRSGEGHCEKETESADEKTEGRVRDGAEQSAGNRFRRAQAGSPGSLRPPLFTHREISYNFTAPLSAAVEKGTDSFLVTHPVSCERGCHHGKIQTFGIRSGLPLLAGAAASEQTAAPRNVCEICVCVRLWGGRIAGIKSNRTPHSGGPVRTAPFVCILAALSAGLSRSVSLCLPLAGERMRRRL